MSMEKKKINSSMSCETMQVSTILMLNNCFYTNHTLNNYGLAHNSFQYSNLFRTLQCLLLALKLRKALDTSAMPEKKKYCESVKSE